LAVPPNGDSMSVIRNRHNAKNQYIVLDQATAWDENLSLKAIGLWARCISRPDNWTFFISEMAKNGKEKERAIYAAIRELKEANLCIFMQHRIVGTKEGKKINRIASTEYFFFQIPLTEDEKEKFIEQEREKFKKYLQDGGFVDVGFVDVENDALTKNNSKYTEENIQTVAAPIESKESTKHPNETLEKAGLDGKQIGKLMKEFPKEEIDEAIKFMKQQTSFIENPFGWLRKCLKEKWHNNAKLHSKENLINKNIAMAKHIESKVKGNLKHNSNIEAGPNGIIFYRGANIWEFIYTLVNFEEKVNSELNKMNLMELVYGNRKE